MKEIKEVKQYMRERGRIVERRKEKIIKKKKGIEDRRKKK
jgi:hypothetical protein